MEKLNFQQPLLQSTVSILYADLLLKKTIYIIIINV